MITHQQMLDVCLRLPGAWPDEPWDGVVVKVADKIFVFLGAGPRPDELVTVGVKCGRGRDEADEWLDRYPDDATPMAYIGRYGWNRLRANGRIPDEEVLEAVAASYADVVARLPKGRRPR